MQYKYLSEPQKPFFSVGKAIIALLIILFNFWSFDVFARSNYTVMECNGVNSLEIYKAINPTKLHVTLVTPQGGDSFVNPLDGIVYEYLWYKRLSSRSNSSFYACPTTHERQYIVKTCDNPDVILGTYESITSGLSDKFRSIKSFPAGTYVYNNYDYKFMAEYEWDSPLGVIPITYYACNITDVVEKTVIINECNYGESAEQMAPFIDGDWLTGDYAYNGNAYKFNREDDDFIYYSCLLNHEYPQENSCFENNPDAVASFTINEKQSLPLTGGRFNFAGCAYNVQQTANVSKDWSGSCYDFTLTRYDIKTSANNTLPNLSACSVDSNPDQSDDENVQKVLNNQLPLASNQQQILDKQNQLSNQLSDFETNMTNNQNDLANKLDTIKNDSTNNKNELSNKLDAIKNNQNQMISNQDDIKSDVSQMSDDLEANDQQISDKLSELENGNGDQTAALKDINNTLKNNHSDIQSLINEPSLTTPQQHFDNGVDLLSSVGDDAATQELSSLDGVIDDLTKGPAGGENSKINATAVLPWQRQLNKYIPKASSCDLSLPNPITGGSIAFNTDWSVKLKSILAWVISFHTFLSLFEILFTPVKPKN